MKLIKRRTIENGDVESYALKAGVSETTARLMLLRDIKEPHKFLNPDISLLHDPFLFPAMQSICERIQLAISRKEHIAVFSDYDADGVCGAAIMYLELLKMGADVEVYIPDRFTEGYGTNPLAFKKLANNSSTLIITVDCGIKSVSDVALAKELGTDVIILDHHECETLPDTPYIINPKIDPYPCKNLCGAGVAFKTVSALRGEPAQDLIDLAGIATIGDIVSLTDENRVISALALSSIKASPRPGIQAIADVAGFSLETATSRTVAFMVVPRLNAAGRMLNARLAFELLTKEDDLPSLAKQLDELNTQRKNRQAVITTAAFEQVRNNSDLSKDRVLMVRGKDWDLGVLGLAAGAIAEHFWRPTVVLSESDGILTGSARSIPEVNIYHLLNSQSKRYLRFGGHVQAAGLSFKPELFDDIKCELNAFARSEYNDNAFLKSSFYDESLAPQQITLELAEELSQLQPFGVDNEVPAFLIQNAQVKSSVLLKNKHLKLNFGTFTSIAFNFDKLIPVNSRVTLLGELSVNQYMGKKDAQITVSYIEHPPIPQTREYTRSFIKELHILERLINEKDNPKVYTDERNFLESLLHDCSKPIGTAVVINSVPGLELAKKLDLFSIGLNISHSCIPADTAENTICMSARSACSLSSFSDTYIVGAFSCLSAYSEAHVLLTPSLQNAYIMEARKYYASDDEISICGEAFNAMQGMKFKTVTELLEAASARTGVNAEKIWFAANVFCELALLRIKNDGRIHVKYCSRPVLLQESATYRVFGKLLQKEG